MSSFFSPLLAALILFRRVNKQIEKQQMRKKNKEKKKRTEIFTKTNLSHTRTHTPDLKYVTQLSCQQTFKTLRGLKN